MKGRIHSTESFGTVDGPGVRFVVFFQGCPMRCRYCHNPDTWKFDSGKEVTPEELLREYDSCKEFFRSGGLTASGGEPLAQPEFLLELFSQAHKKGIHTCLDTSGAVYDPDAHDMTDRILKQTDLVMLDIKHIDNLAHKALTGADNENILGFARHLRELDIPVWIRHVVVPGLTDGHDELFRLGVFLSELDNLKALDVLPYHDMAKSKYRELGIRYTLPDTPALTKEEAMAARDVIMSGLKHGLRQQKQNG